MYIILRRLLISLPALLLLSLTVFCLLELTPGDAAMAVLDATANEAQHAQVREAMGLNRPLLQRYVDYLGGLLRGEMGISIRSGQPVTKEIGVRLPYTLVLVGAALVLGGTAGVLLGMVAAFKQNTLWDTLITALISIGMATPTFWLALLLVNLFALQLRWLPVFGADTLRHLVLPAVCTSLALAPGVARLTRASLLEIFGADFIRAAHAKGLRSALVFRRHISPVAAIPVVTYIGVQTVRLITAAAVMEIIFGWPGLGGLLVHAAFDRDPFLLQGATLALALMAFAILFVVDLAVLYLDPRLSHKVI